MSDNVKMINFMGGRRIAMFISIAVMLASVAVLAVKGLNFG
ncbi:MAG: preprotein translocase subunit SecF, partial [Zhongshania marina]